MAKSPIAKRLKEARLEAGLSQKSLGIAAGIDEFTASARMNQYETGKHTPDYSSLASIAKVLKVPVAYFYADSDDIALVIKLFIKLDKIKKSHIISKLQAICTM